MARKFPKYIELALGLLLIGAWGVHQIVEFERDAADLRRISELVSAPVRPDEGAWCDPESDPIYQYLAASLDPDRHWWLGLWTAGAFLGLALFVAGVLRLTGAKFEVMIMPYAVACLPIALLLVSGVMLLKIGGPLHQLTDVSVMLLAFFVGFPLVWGVYYALVCRFAKHAEPPHAAPAPAVDG